MNFRLSVALLLLLAAHSAFAASGRAPTPALKDSDLPPEGVSCLSAEIDGGQFYHVDFEKPLHTAKEVQVEAKKLGLDVKLRGAITHEPRVQKDGERIVAAVEGKGGDAGSYEVGNVCYVLMRYCAPGCGGQWCVTVRVPSLQ